MKSKKIILIAGGDLRQKYAAAELADLPGVEVHATGFTPNTWENTAVIPWDGADSDAAVYDVLVLPIPASADGIRVHAPFGSAELLLETLASYGKPGALVLGGQVRDAVRDRFERRQMIVEDYLQREELALANAVPTAEGAIQIAMEETPRTLHGERVLLVGFGRIGMALAPRLRALGMEVVVCARRCETRALAKMNGCRAVPMHCLKEEAARCGLVMNTVPALMLNRSVLEVLPSDALVIDLASRPGGTDFDAAKQCGTRVVWALSLPGKVAPMTAGGIIADTIRNILEERGLAHERIDR